MTSPDRGFPDEKSIFFPKPLQHTQLDEQNVTQMHRNVGQNRFGLGGEFCDFITIRSNNVYQKTISRHQPNTNLKLRLGSSSFSMAWNEASFSELTLLQSSRRRLIEELFKPDSSDIILWKMKTNKTRPNFSPLTHQNCWLLSNAPSQRWNGQFRGLSACSSHRHEAELGKQSKTFAMTFFSFKQISNHKKKKNISRNGIETSSQLRQMRSTLRSTIICKRIVQKLMLSNLIENLSFRHGQTFGNLGKNQRWASITTNKNNTPAEETNLQKGDFQILPASFSWTNETTTFSLYLCCAFCSRNRRASFLGKA